jgi:hypothetical protein
VVANVRERLVVSKQAAQTIDVERFIRRKLSELEVRKQYYIKISNRFAALKNVNDSKDINRTLITLNGLNPQLKSPGLYELKKQSPRFGEECLRFLDQRKRSRL